MSDPQATEHVEDVVVLARSSLLAGLPLQDIGALLEYLEPVAAAPDELVAAEGTRGQGLCFLLAGSALLARRRCEPVPLNPGDHFGELTLAPEGRHDATVTAVTALRLARLTPTRWDELAEAHPQTALHLARALFAALARRTATAQRIEAAGPDRRREERPARITRTNGAQRGECAEVPTGTRVADLLPPSVDGSLVVGARLDQLTVPLHAPILTSAALAPLTTRTWEGREIYRRTAGLALLEAAQRIGCRDVRLGPSITSGRVVYTDATGDPTELAARLNAALSRVVEDDLPLREEVWKVDEAIDHFTEVGWDDAATLLSLWHEPTVLLVGCGSVLALDPGPVLPSTGMLEDVSVRSSGGGLILDFGSVIRRELPSPPRSTVQLEAKRPRYGADMTLQKQRWLELLGVTSIGHFGRACVSGQVSQLIQVSEGFHEKRIALIADEVKTRGDVRVIGVAGPSSSGKTTFIKRLKIQLEVNGIHPVELSLDDYYVDRERSPRGPDGDYDFEALEALDRALLLDHVQRLLRGERVRTARYDFLTGRSAPAGGPELQLEEASVLLVEGIHALNPALFTPLDGHRTFRIFVHPASSLPYDRLSSFEPADVRLVRRIVRDRHQRGTAAADTLARWPSVRRGERLHIFPYHDQADAVFDSSLVYELSVLRVYAERYLLEVPRSHPEFAAAHRLRRLLQPIVPIYPEHVPPTSILREFIGGSGFTY